MFLFNYSYHFEKLESAKKLVGLNETYWFEKVAYSMSSSLRKSLIVVLDIPFKKIFRINMSDLIIVVG